MKKVFIDGSAGTTGLRIKERLSQRNDIELITLSEELRKDPAARKEALNSCDIAFLCLPDAAAIEAVSMIENENVVVLDTSTAHRTNDSWAYGFPELSEEHFEKVKSAKRIAVPGCHASGFISLVYPLIEKGIISKDTLLTCHSITGYSGGGKKMIAEYEDDGREFTFDAPRQYALGQTHKQFAFRFLSERIAHKFCHWLSVRAHARFILFQAGRKAYCGYGQYGQNLFHILLLCLKFSCNIL